MTAISNRMITLLAVTSLVTGCLAQAASAADAARSDPPEQQDTADEALPLIAIEGSGELQLDSGLGHNRTTAIYTTVEPEVTVNVSDAFRLFGHFVYEPVLDPIDGRTNVFRSQGLYAEELYAGLTVGQATFELGKIHPVFGIATDDAPGIYGSDFASSYDFKGALGLGAQLILNEASTGSGEDALSVRQEIDTSIFTADPSVVSRSLFTDRGQFNLQDNRVGNTRLPESFSLAYVYSTLNADDEVAGPTGRVAVRRLAARESNVSDEWDLLVAGQTAIDLGDEQTLRPLGEIAYFVNENGHRKDAASVTIGLEFQQGDWITSAVAAAHDHPGASGPSDYMLTASVGRIFETAATGKFRVDAAYSNARVDGVETNVVGLRLHKNFSWQSSSSGSE